MKVYGDLERAQLESKTSDYAGTIRGAIWLHTSENRVKISDGTIVKQFLLNDDKIIVGTSGTSAENIRLYRAGAGVLQFVPATITTAEGTLSTTLAQTSSRQENYTTAARPAFGNAGRTIYNTDEAKLQVDTGSSWINVGTSGASVSVDTLEQKGFAEHANVFGPPLLNSLYDSFAIPKIDVQLWFMEDYVSPATTISAVVNPTWLDAANKNFDGVSGWTAFDAETANIDAESGTKKLGASALSFDKVGGGGGSTLAGVYKALATPVNISEHGDVEMWVNMPSVIGFVNFKIRLASADETDVATNFQEYTVTLNSAGGAIVAGWNHLLFNILNGQGTATGTGYNRQLLLGVAGFFVTTSPGTQSYTNIVVDSWVFNHADYDLLLQAGDVLQGYNTSNIFYPQLAVSSASRGLITLQASLGANFSGGTGTTIKRSNADTSQKNILRSQTGLSGEILKRQSHFIKTIYPGVIPSADWELSVSQYSDLFHDISDVDSTSQIKVTNESATDFSAQFVSGNKYLVFQPVKGSGKTFYVYKGELTLSANSTFGTGKLTLQNSGSNSGVVAVGYKIVKKEVELFYSSVGASTIETLGSAITPTTVYLTDIGNPYPAPDKVYGHWRLGGLNGLLNLKGPAVSLAEQGGPVNKGRTYMNGFYGVGPFASTGRLYLPLNDAIELSGDSGLSSGIFSISFWLYVVAFPSGGEALVSYSTSNPSGNTWLLYHNNGGGLVWISSGGSTRLTIANTATPIGAWHHILMVWEDSVSCVAYVNGIKYIGTSANHVSDTGAMFAIGNDQAAANPSVNGYLADVIAWGNYKATDADALSIYRGGLGGGLTGILFSLRHRYEVLGTAAVQKGTIRLDILKETDDVEAQVDFVGTIKR